MSDGVSGGDIGSGFGTLRDVCSFFSSAVFVKNHWLFSWGCCLEFDACHLIRLLADMASCLRSLINVPPFPLYRPFVDCYRFLMALIMLSSCVVVGFVMCLCCNMTVS